MPGNLSHGKSIGKIWKSRERGRGVLNEVQGTVSVSRNDYQPF